MAAGSSGAACGQPHTVDVYFAFKAILSILFFHEIFHFLVGTDVYWGPITS